MTGFRMLFALLSALAGNKKERNRTQDNAISKQDEQSD
jgi:hypothetical protein